MTNGELAQLVEQMDSASVAVHAAMLEFDTRAGLLRRAIEEKILGDDALEELDRAHVQAVETLGLHSVRRPLEVVS